MLTKADIEKYFVAEKHESLLFIVVGLCCLLIALLLFLLLKTSIFRGASVPLLLLGLVEASVGYTVYVRSDDQRKASVYAYDMNPDLLRTAELGKMKRVTRNFKIYQAAELGLLLTGIVLGIAFRSSLDQRFWVGFGVALALQSAILLIADSVAAKRAYIYQHQLEQFASSPAKDTGIPEPPL